MHHAYISPRTLRRLASCVLSYCSDTWPHMTAGLLCAVLLKTSCCHVWVSRAVGIKGPACSEAWALRPPHSQQPGSCRCQRRRLPSGCPWECPAQAAARKPSPAGLHTQPALTAAAAAAAPACAPSGCSPSPACRRGRDSWLLLFSRPFPVIPCAAKQPRWDQPELLPPLHLQPSRATC